MRFFSFIVLAILLFLSGCRYKKDKSNLVDRRAVSVLVEDTVADCHYSFEEALCGTRAPEYITRDLRLIDVTYYSLDRKLHKGQVLTNVHMVDLVKKLFRIFEKYHFPVVRVIPVVKYAWNDEKSMGENNTYSFCYRNLGYSKHAYGLAIDVNPYFNPVRAKAGYRRTTKPAGAYYDPSRPGTFVQNSRMIKEILALGLKWGRFFSMKNDDHHFEMPYRMAGMAKSEEEVIDSAQRPIVDQPEVNPSDTIADE